ncbi:DNA adenine methylase [Salmonirosea aquatica]|uniref:site-specific DNA-methyltransferase (adenine-specific) n=1 Tax=Salmonirosea aquatica TaxID=2654236 RepID=A0A7C9BKR5_9BACT|nr:DNA adenine methylase [Cytophagaceae bacterium SJW1-29]
MKNLLSPLRYPGGKSALGKFLADVILANDLQGGTYYELYCGGAGAALYLLDNRIVNQIVINDADYRIYAFWHSILNKTDQFIQQIENCALTIPEWKHYKDIYDNATPTSNIFEIGFATFYLNRTSRSGILHKSGPIGGYQQVGNYLIDARFYKNTLINRIAAIAELESAIQIHNETAESFIQDFSQLTDYNSAFFYLDPPYFNKGKMLYLNNYSTDGHLLLANLIQLHPDINWLISYDNADEIRDIYQPFRMASFNLRYSLQSKRIGSELMIFSDTLIIPPIAKDQLVPNNFVLLN